MTSGAPPGLETHVRAPWERTRLAGLAVAATSPAVLPRRRAHCRVRPLLRITHVPLPPRRRCDVVVVVVVVVDARTLAFREGFHGRSVQLR